MKSRIMICGSLLTLLFLCAPNLRAQTPETPAPGAGGEKWQAMRQEMVAACTDKTEGAPCSFSVEGKTVNGTCHATRQKTLICRGARRHGGEMHGPTGGATPSGGTSE